jgi:RES domain-containing protein
MRPRARDTPSEAVASPAECMQVFRLIDQQHMAQVLDGTSAALTGGRWNARGTPVVYASSSVSLAILELLSHYRDALQRAAYCLATIVVPDDAVGTFERSILPPRWQNLPWLTRRLGRQWAAHGELALRVPSAVHDFEDNLLLNPLHPRFDEVHLVSCAPLRLAASVFDQQPDAG